MGTTAHPARLEAGRRIFTRILVGVDGSQDALEAVRHAALLQDVDGQLTLLAIWDIVHGVGGTGSGIPYYLDQDFQCTAAEKGLRAASAPVRITATARPASSASSTVRAEARHRSSVLALGKAEAAERTALQLLDRLKA
jgi:hypothetical protein